MRVTKKFVNEVRDYFRYVNRQKYLSYSKKKKKFILRRARSNKKLVSRFPTSNHKKN